MNYKKINRKKIENKRIENRKTENPPPKTARRKKEEENRPTSGASPTSWHARHVGCVWIGAYNSSTKKLIVDWAWAYV